MTSTTISAILWDMSERGDGWVTWEQLIHKTLTKTGSFPAEIKWSPKKQARLEALLVGQGFDPDKSSQISDGAIQYLSDREAVLVRAVKTGRKAATEELEESKKINTGLLTDLVLHCGLQIRDVREYLIEDKAMPHLDNA